MLREAQGCELEMVVKGRGVRRAVREHSQWGFGCIPLLAGVWVGAWSHLTPSPQGLLTLGERLGREMLGLAGVRHPLEFQASA